VMDWGWLTRQTHLRMRRRGTIESGVDIIGSASYGVEDGELNRCEW